ncbi:structural toxin protein RtxA, partial [Legionella shakespearei DSM 23087]
ITGASGGNFEDLAVDNTAVDTVITDTIDVSSVILTSNAPATVVQGSTVIYTATVSSPVTDSPLIVELSNGQQIIIAVGETFGNVSSVLTTDASVSILSYSGANYESISTSGTVVTEVNHTPVANNDTISTLEDTPATGNVLTNDTDSDGDSLSVVSFTVAGVSGSFNAGQTVLIANVGTLQINENGDYIFTPVTDYNGSVPVVTYTVTDGSSSSSANLNITVTPVNDGPVAVNDTVNVVVSGVLGRLHSDFYNYREGSDGPNLSSVAMAQNFINNHSPNASFSSTTVNYALNGGNNLGGYVNSSNDNLKTWIGADGSSLVRFDNSPLSTGDAIIHMTGLVNLAAGSYNFRVTADDGYTILIDGVAVATRDLNQSPTTTTFESFNIDTSGLHQIEIVYWDQGGQYVLQVELQKGTDGYHYLGTSDSSGNGVFSLDTLIDVSTLLANDTDVDDPHSSLSIVSVANASHGIVSLDGLGHVVLSVEPGYAGPVTFQYTIQDPHGAQSTATVTVNVEQLTVSIAVSPAGVLEDGSDNLVYTVTLSHPSAFDTTVNYQLSGTATNGTDYTGSAVTGSVIVPAGQLTGTFTIDPTADNLLEANETVIATITSAVSNSVALITAGDPAIGTIINDDTANAVLSVTTHGAEGGSNIVYTVTLSKVNNTGAPITFDIATTGGTATSGSDYTAIPAGAKITVANGSSTGTYTLPVTNDTLPEATETVQATISNSSNASVSIGTASATANITDNDFAPALSLPNVINIVNPGSTSIFTGAGLGTPNGTDQGAGVSQSNLETELSLTSGRLDLFDPPSHGSGSNAYNDPGNVNAIDGKLTNSNYSLQSGDTISFNWSFINGEDSRAEINDGFNDLAVLVVTQPDGTKVLVQISSSEQAEALKTVSGIYNFSATQTGNYQFSWLVLNGGDANKDSRVNITATRVFRGSTEYGDPFALTINAALKVTDGSETLKVRISGVPTVGATFSAGTNLGGGVWEFTTAELVGLIYYPPTTFTSGSIDLTVTAIATETSTGTTASTSQTLTLSVDHTTNTISSGTEGGDSITGTANNDLIHGYAGNDTINAGGGNDLIYGGAGNDTINGQGGNDTIYGGIGNDIISGGDGNDLLFGEAGDDTLNGNAGNDILYGGAGNDILNGGLGNDFLSGGKGNDTLTGGGGIDTFIWMQGDGGTVASKAVDTITDFKANPVGTSADASVLNLSDLLSGEHADTLDSYLSISKTGSDTTISIDPTGHLNPNNIAGTATQTIVLQGVDLTAVFSTTNSHDIINHLIANGNLITDH